MKLANADCSLEKEIHCVMNYNLRHTFVAYVVVQGIGEGVSKPKNLGHRRKRASIQYFAAGALGETE